MSFCIFIASSTATTSPSFTASPTLTGTFTILLFRLRAALVSRRELGKHEVDQDHVVGRLEAKLTDLLPRGFDLRLEEVRRAERDRLFASEHQAPQLVVGRHGRAAIQA